MNVKSELLEAAKVRGMACVTVTLNTHRAAPDHLKDPIRLKNLLKEAEARVKDEHGAKVAEVVMAKLHELADAIDHAHNLDGMVLFANTEFSGMAKLPVRVTDRVSVDDRFATRDLTRALQIGTDYYILWLNRGTARLVRAFNDVALGELKGDFPVKNHVAGHGAPKRGLADGDPVAETKEFFNRADKALGKHLNHAPLPVVLATEARNAELYRAVADRKGSLKADFNPSHDGLALNHLAAEAWRAFGPVVKARYNERAKALGAAASAGKLHNDLNDVWRAIGEGRGDTLFVKEDLFRPAMVVDEKLELLPESERERHGAVDDIIDEMIQRNEAHGGSTVFVEGDELDKYDGLALVTRF